MDSRTLINNLWNIARRSVHFKVTPKTYPKVNIKDVELNKPRFGFRRERDPLISQSVTDTLFPNTEIKSRYGQAGKPVPIKYRTNSDQIARRNFESFQDEIATGKPHFKVGEKKVYFPAGRICLIKPSAKYSPYQARFLVPKSMNKMDLRDYLWHLYGLRALNITVQLTHAKYRRGRFDYSRHRSPQFKFMTIEMEEPFVWPEFSEEFVKNKSQLSESQLELSRVAVPIGSDADKPNSVFGGIFSKTILPNAFIPSKVQKAGSEQVKSYQQRVETKHDRQSVKQYLGL
ncbi:hypothetical protein DFJ63DRAFT_318982 [Scheffersomyces coipomensis]|uniref:uncharacterized protein n=1 Tax=Scheffersomyces coipomensis TaxID=1788519 RepID=UPI00315D9E68